VMKTLMKRGLMFTRSCVQELKECGGHSLPKVGSDQVHSFIMKIAS
jgi:hypothetical protein